MSSHRNRRGRPKPHADAGDAGFNALSPGQKSPLPTARQASSIPMAPETDGAAGAPEEDEGGREISSEEGKHREQLLRRRPRPRNKQKESKPGSTLHSRCSSTRCDGRAGPRTSRTWPASSRSTTRSTSGPGRRSSPGRARRASGLAPRPCGGPRLARFVGRPKDLSPKARFLNLLGYRLPFDRHDWFVDRCGKERVRYVIDFYNAAPAAAPSPTRRLLLARALPLLLLLLLLLLPPPALPAPVSMHLDVRPALDSPGAAWERLKAAVGRVAARSDSFER